MVLVLVRDKVFEKKQKSVHAWNEGVFGETGEFGCVGAGMIHFGMACTALGGYETGVDRWMDGWIIYNYSTCIA